jgi:hypothetical protein
MGDERCRTEVLVATIRWLKASTAAKLNQQANGPVQDSLAGSHSIDAARAKVPDPKLVTDVGDHAYRG